jgi:CRISPR-associated protein Cmr4
MSQLRTVWKGGLLGLHALTAMHPGSGAALGTVDLPVQRERHTQWPTIAGSALKGVLRDACREIISRRTDLNDLDRHDDDKGKDKPEDRTGRRKGSRRDLADSTLMLNELFGPPTSGSGEFAGATTFTDARLLAFPVRSLKGVYAWVTCNSVLQRLARDLALLGETLPTLAQVPQDEHALVVAGKNVCAVSGTLVLEEFDFKVDVGDAAPVANWIADNVLPDSDSYDATRKRLPGQFVVLSDNDFTHFALHATEVTARIGLNYETKTARDGALFYQEFLPTEVLFYSLVLVNAARTRAAGADAQKLFDNLSNYLATVPILQIGGDETTGKGFCGVRFRSAKENQS